jgi:hypothetical protein
MVKTQRGRYDAFDRGTGSGAAPSEDDFLEEQSMYSNEWGSAAATTFNPSDTDAHGNRLPKQKQQKFEDLYALNNGKGERTRKTDILASHVKNDAETFMSVLEMPTPQRKRVLHILNNIDVDSNKFGGRKYEKIILAICSLVCDQALSRMLSQDDYDIVQERRLYNREQFKDLMDSVNMSGTEYRSIRRQVKSKSDTI